MYGVVHYARNCLHIFWSIVEFRPTHMNIRVFEQMKQQNRWCVIEQLHCYEEIEIMNENWCLLVYLHCHRSRKVACGVFAPGQSIHCI